ncbi:hypothetical protein V6N13_011350 [Hibiscus sabdariffa]|uniref:Protein TIFY n=1 Tax=Hibiscus sabdariffa TaxID=183260 RepID=A0ABR2SBZ1_9ROSI
MRRNCNLELGLLPSSYPGDSHDMMEESSRSPENQLQQLTIFYNGRLCVCDVTELHAKAILKLASRERDETIKTPTALPTPVNNPSTAISMKRSLQRFLQKRKMRIQATSPYHYCK